MIILTVIFIYYNTPNTRQSLPDKIREELGIRLSEWQELRTGKLQVSDLSLCLEGKEPSCFGQNPASPYTLPNWSYPSVSSFEGIPLTDQLAISSFQLDPNELFVLYGFLPPVCSYWGFTAYLINSPNKCSGDELAASLANTINNVNSRLDFNQPWALIVGCNNDIINKFVNDLDTKYKPLVMKIPFIGRNANLTVLGRTALFEDEQAALKYYSYTNTFCTVIKYQHTYDVSQTISSVELTPRNTYFNELTEAPTTAVFNAQAELYLSKLLKALPSSYQYIYNIEPHLFYEEYNYDSGYDCIQACRTCLFDNRDVIYTISPIINNINANESIVAVFGVNHSIYGKSLYTNISIYDTTTDYGLVSFDYVDTDPANYELVVTPNELNNVNVPEGTDVYILPSNVHTFSVAERAYVQTINANGPDYSGISAAANTLIKPRIWIISTIKDLNVN